MEKIDNTMPGEPEFNESFWDSITGGAEPQNGEHAQQAAPAPAPAHAERLVINGVTIPDIHKLTFTLHSAEEARGDQPPTEYLLAGKIPVQTVSCFYGEPGGKKTYSLLSLALHVATGRAWLGMETKKARVLYLDEENGSKRLLRRMGEIMRGEEITEPVDTLQFETMGGILLDNRYHALQVEELIRRNGAQFVIVDALAEVMAGEENSKMETQPVLNALKHIAEHAGATIVVLHHPNRNGGIRGTSAIKASVDNQFKIECQGKNTVNFMAEKSRDDQVDPWSAAATWLIDQEYLQRTGWRRFNFTLRAVEPEEKRSALEGEILDYLAASGATSLPDLARAMVDMGACKSIASARAEVYKLGRSGEIFRTNPDAGGRTPAIYERKRLP